MENNILSSHIYDRVHSLNLWWSPPWMWKKGAQFLSTPGVPNNFPVGNTSIEIFYFNGQIEMITKIDS